MLTELVVTDLGVIARGEIVFREGMTALTGETGAGKTLVVEAIALLLGGRAEATLVRAGCDEARVDGRFERVSDGVVIETVLSRVVARSGRSRAYVDGRPVPVSSLTEIGATLVDLHGQHAHQSLVGGAAQRAALDAFGGIDLGPLRDARARLRSLVGERDGLGGDERARAREMDLLRFQVHEIEAARIEDADEDDRLEALEDELADAAAHRDAGRQAGDALSGEGGAGESVAIALRVLASQRPYASLAPRLRALAAELGDIADEARSVAERIDEDPQRLDALRQRRQNLRQLRKKYGEDLGAVLTFGAEAGARLAELSERERRAETIDREIEAARSTERELFERVVAARRKVSATLATAIETRLGSLAMPNARIRIDVDDTPADQGEGVVTILLAANPGAEPSPLTKVASGGELARIMLALRLALLDGRSLVTGDPPDTLLFDEVDAGIGGEAAVAVGRALATMADGRQVLVVTHLPQVAACADEHVLVQKVSNGDSTSTTVTVLDKPRRVTELARMLSGSPDSATAQKHARELMSTRGRPKNATTPERRTPRGGD